MFTGIVVATGRIASVDDARVDAPDAQAGVRVVIDAPTLGLDDVRIGDSIAVSGACMTVVARDATSFAVDVSRESLDRTGRWTRDREVNLEKSLRLGDRLDGHLVAGHVDGTGRVERLAPVGESWALVVRVPASLARFIAAKGSLAVDGVSLTVNTVDDRGDGCDAAFNLIPHTVASTTLRHLQAGDVVNLEVDTLARYVERMLAAPRDTG